MLSFHYASNFTGQVILWHELQLGKSPIKINREILKGHGCDC